MKGRILIIEDDPTLASSLQRVLESENYSVRVSARRDEGLSLARDQKFDVVVTDLQLAGQTTAGLELLGDIQGAKPRLPVILMTAHHSTDIAIEATKFGAYEYLPKPFDSALLLTLLANAVQSSRLMFEPIELGISVPTRDAIVGDSRAMQHVYKEIGRMAAKPVTVLIRGETGTGKELVARALYQHSERHSNPFIIVNCVAIPEPLLESELFGHEQGAFTGAVARRIGKFEQANEGTIFLDEVGDMGLNTQAKLLRVLQEKTIQRVGGKETIPVDVRILAATHRDLEASIAEKQFRGDLYYRLNDAVIPLPALRERTEDIPALVNYFIGRHSTALGIRHPFLNTEALNEMKQRQRSSADEFTQALNRIGAIESVAMVHLQQQQWPGNVRELENVIRKALLAAGGYTITRDHIENALSKTRLTRPKTDQTLAGYVSELLAEAMRGGVENVHYALTESMERELYTQAIRLAGGNQVKAAKWLGVSRPTLREKLKRFGLIE
jgi:DNA-binding NtrC family response regulator